MITPMYLSIYYLAQMPEVSLWKVMVIVFSDRLGFQFVGHKIEEKTIFYTGSRLF